MTQRTLIVVCLIAALSGAACTDSTGPALGSLKVSIVTEGGDPDEDGYSLVIDSNRIAMGPVATFHVTVTAQHPHLLSLEGIADNCAIEGDPPRSITIRPDEMAEVAFVVKCDATGIVVTSHGSGPDQPSSYLVAMGGRPPVMSLNGSAQLTRVRPGWHSVSLTAPPHCRVTTANPVTAEVKNRALTSVTFEITCVSSDKRIAFVRDTSALSGFMTQFVFASNAEGTSLIPLAQGRNPAWSPDGTRLLYSNANCDFYYRECFGGLVLMIPQTDEKNILHAASLGDDPSWSPDGKSIAFSQLYMTSTPQLLGGLLHVMPVNGTSVTHLATPGMQTRKPSWSQDSKRIVFECVVPSQGSPALHEICIINADGTGFTRVISSPGFVLDPAWSPDGTRIAFSTTGFGAAKMEIALMAPDGTNVTRITEGFEPEWLPDGSRLIFARDDGLFTIGVDGSGLTRITTGNHRTPAWRPQ